MNMKEFIECFDKDTSVTVMFNDEKLFEGKAGALDKLLSYRPTWHGTTIADGVIHIDGSPL